MLLNFYYKSQRLSSFSRLARAFEDLQKIVDNEQDLKETEEYAAAVTILEQAKEHLPTAEA